MAEEASAELAAAWTRWSLEEMEQKEAGGPGAVMTPPRVHGWEGLDLA